jgi:hypothetical protein
MTIVKTNALHRSVRLSLHAHHVDVRAIWIGSFNIPETFREMFPMATLTLIIFDQRKVS